MRKSLKRVLAATGTAMVLAASLPAATSMAWRDGGPEPSDFTVNGTFDQTGYVAGLIAFESAPVLPIGQSITLRTFDCPIGTPITAVFVGFPATQVNANSTSNPTNFGITSPSDIPVGFNIIRVTCTAAAKTTIDVIVDMRAPGTPGAITQLTVRFLGTTTGIPAAGSDVRSILGTATAALLVGVAAIVGARRRFRVAAIG